MYCHLLPALQQVEGSGGGPVEEGTSGPAALLPKRYTCSCLLQVGLHEALESGPAVRYVPVLPTGPNPTTVELQDALPLASLLAPVGTRKEAIAAMLEAMQPHPPGVRQNERACCARVLHASMHACLCLWGVTVEGGRRVGLGRPPARQGLLVWWEHVGVPMGWGQLSTTTL